MSNPSAPSVVVHRHKGESGVESRVDDRKVEPVAGRDRFPKGQPRPTHRVHADPHSAGADGVEIDHTRRDRATLRLDVIVFLRRRGAERRRERHPFDFTVSRRPRVCWLAFRWPRSRPCPPGRHEAGCT